MRAVLTVGPSCEMLDIEVSLPSQPAVDAWCMDLWSYKVYHASVLQMMVQQPPAHEWLKHPNSIRLDVGQPIPPYYFDAIPLI